MAQHRRVALVARCASSTSKCVAAAGEFPPPLSPPAAAAGRRGRRRRRWRPSRRRRWARPRCRSARGPGRGTRRRRSGPRLRPGRAGWSGPRTRPAPPRRRPPAAAAAAAAGDSNTAKADKGEREGERLGAAAVIHSLAWMKTHRRPSLFLPPALWPLLGDRPSRGQRHALCATLGPEPGRTGAGLTPASPLAPRRGVHCAGAACCAAAAAAAATKRRGRCRRRRTG